MTCAACVARVEKAVNKVEGVTGCSVSLLTNSMGVEGEVSAEKIIKAVQDAGYDASEKGASKQPSAAQEDALADRETPVLKRRLFASLGFLLVLMYVSMGHVMWGWPLPAALAENPLAPIYTASAPWSMAAIPTCKSRAGESNSIRRGLFFIKNYRRWCVIYAMYRFF